MPSLTPISLANSAPLSPLSAHCSIRFAHSSRRAMRDHVAQAASSRPAVLAERIPLIKYVLTHTYRNKPIAWPLSCR